MFIVVLSFAWTQFQTGKGGKASAHDPVISGWRERQCAATLPAIVTQ